MHSAIYGMGWYAPEEVITNDFFCDGDYWFFYDRHGERIPDTSHPTGYSAKKLTHELIVEKVSGIQERRRAAPGEYARHLAAKAFEDSGWDPKDLDTIIFATVSAEKDFAHAASDLQDMIGATNVRLAKGTQMACAGWQDALWDAHHRVLDTGKYVLVVGAETLTRRADYEGRDINANLFGDGAGVAIVGPSKEPGILAPAYWSNPHGGRVHYITQDKRGYIRMESGPRVLKEAIRVMSDLTRTLEKKTEWKGADFYAYHQANNRITNGVIKELRADPSKVGNNIHLYGNMSAATSVMLLAQHWDELPENARIITAAFASGLVGTAVALRKVR